MKVRGTVKFSSPSAVQSALSISGYIYEKGMIIVDIPEMGYLDIPAYYGLSLPWIQVQPTWEVWIDFEPDQNRFVMTGIHNTGAISDTDMFLLSLPAGTFKITIGNNTLETDGATSWKLNGASLEVKV